MRECGSGIRKFKSCHPNQLLQKGARLGALPAWLAIGVSAALSIATRPAADYAIPPDEAWTDYGVILSGGTPGKSWDVMMEGYTPCALIKKDGLYYLYYVGSKDYISQKDNIGPADRSIGLATSQDGIHWAKHPGNPVLTFSATGNPEEGVPSAGVFLAPTGQFVAYYGANISVSATSSSVHADARLAISNDGFGFTDLGVVIAHSDSLVYGHGDEIHSVEGLYLEGNYHAFYIPNGGSRSKHLSVARGASIDRLNSTSPVISGGSVVRTRGNISVVPLGGGKYAFFLLDLSTRKLQARLARSSQLTELSAPVATYDLESLGAVVYLDRERNTWFKLSSHWSHVTLQLAPAGPRDATSPSKPARLEATAPSHEQVRLSWAPATDTETGVVEYRLLRDGVAVGSTRDLSFSESGLKELTTYTYEVYAVNLHGTVGPRASVTISTPPDVTPPAIERVYPGGSPEELVIRFSEEVDSISATAISNYQIDPLMRTHSARVSHDGRSVVLGTDPHLIEHPYSVTVNRIRDRSSNQNARVSDARAYTFSEVPSLVWHLGFDSLHVTDHSGYGHEASLQGSPAVVGGILGGAISLNGQTDYVDVPLSDAFEQAWSGPGLTLMAWAKIEGIPPATTNSNFAYAVLATPGALIRYESDQTFVASLRTTAGRFMLRSPAISPRSWHHLALVVNRAAMAFSFYVDGQPVSGSPRRFAGDFAHRFPPEANLGRYYRRTWIGVQDPKIDNERSYLHGVVDEVRAYSSIVPWEKLVPNRRLSCRRTSLKRGWKPGRT